MGALDFGEVASPSEVSAEGRAKGNTDTPCCLFAVDEHRGTFTDIAQIKFPVVGIFLKADFISVMNRTREVGELIRKDESGEGHPDALKLHK